MGLFSMLDTSATGLTAQRLRMDVIANNIANAETTRQEGAQGPYRRRRIIFEPRDYPFNGKKLPFMDQPLFSLPATDRDLESRTGKGVKAVKIEDDYDHPLKMRWDPGHPDAVKDGKFKGYVMLPNVEIVTEMVDMISASRAYEANATAIRATKSMISKAMEIGK